MLTRREFMQGSLAASVLLALPFQDSKPMTKPIKGSWINIWWDDARHAYWNDTTAKFTAEQWGLAVKDVADIGMEYLVLMSMVKAGKAFFETPQFPKMKLGCEDPVEALLSGADKHGVKFFVSPDWDDADNMSGDAIRMRLNMMSEIAQRYGHHKSFYGWYFPKETSLRPYFHENFITYLNQCSREAHQLTPQAKTLTAPFGTRLAVCDDKFVKQLDRLDVDFMAYQDEVGCGRIGPQESAKAFAKLRQAHDKVPERKLWADVEMFTWEGRVDYAQTPLIPAAWTRIKKQLDAVSPHVDTILIYIYQGLMNRPDSKAFAGHPDSTRLYGDYVAWLKKEHPHMVGY